MFHVQIIEGEQAYRSPEATLLLAVVLMAVTDALQARDPEAIAFCTEERGGWAQARSDLCWPLGVDPDLLRVNTQRALRASPSREPSLTPSETRVLEAIDSGAPATLRSIEEASGVPKTTCSHAVAGLVAKGLLKCVGRGLYTLPGTEHPKTSLLKPNEERVLDSARSLGMTQDTPVHRAAVFEALAGAMHQSTFDEMLRALVNKGLLARAGGGCYVLAEPPSSPASCPAPQPRRTGVKVADAIAQVVREAGKPVTAAEIAAAIGKHAASIYTDLSVLVKKGVLYRPSKGVYTIKT